MKNKKEFKGFKYLKKYRPIGQVMDTCPLSCATCMHLRTIDWLELAECHEDTEFLRRLPEAFCTK